MNIINFVKENAAPIGVAAGAVIFGAAAICTYKAMTKVEKLNNETEEKAEAEAEAEVEEKNETIEKAKALIPMFGIIALSVIGTKLLDNGNIMLSGLTGGLTGAVYALVKSPYNDSKTKKNVLVGGIIHSVVGTFVMFPILNGIKYFISHKEAII